MNKKLEGVGMASAGTVKSDLLTDVYSGVKLAVEQRTVTLQDGLDKALQFIIDKDYGNAVSWLLEAYSIVADRAKYHSMLNEWGEADFNRIFEWICLRLSFCFGKMRDFTNAYYYIDLVAYSGDCDCFLQWIEVVIDSGRLEALGLVMDFLVHLPYCSELWSMEDCQKVRNFLSNRLGYLYIEYGLLDEAREYFEGFLSSTVASNVEYAREGLEYLACLQDGVTLN